MKKSIYFQKRLKGNGFMAIFLSVLTLILLTVSPAAAAVNSWDISPANPVPGDTLHIKGRASPGEEIEVQVTFEKTVPVSGGKYEYILEGVKIPEGFKNRFTVQASGARNLNVRVKMLIWMTKSSEASGNTATVTQSSVPPGTYQIKMDGDASGGVSAVDLKITAVQRIKASSNGDFSYSYNTKTIPPGDFEINVGGIKKKVTLQQEKISPVTPGSFSERTEPETTEGTVETEDSEATLNPDPTGETTLNPDPADESGTKESGTKMPASEIEAKGSKTHENEGLPVDVLYILGGMGAAVLILIIYSKRK